MRLASQNSLVAVLALLLAGAPLFAQAKPKPPVTTGKAPATTGKARDTTEKAPATPVKIGTASIAGVVLDSLNGTYLRGADVIIQGAKVSLVTDSVGKFRVDNLPAGTYQIGVFHPMLDTLGIALARQPFHLGQDSTSFLLLSLQCY